jgi:hypothetical protein
MNHSTANNAPVHQTGRHDIVKIGIVLISKPTSSLQTDDKKTRQQTANEPAANELF